MAKKTNTEIQELAIIPVRNMIYSIRGENIILDRDIAALYGVTTAQLTSEIAELRAKIELLESRSEENLEAVNDLSEDMRQEIDNLYNAIGAWPLRRLPRKRILDRG